MTDKERLRGIEKADMRILFQVPFWAPGVIKLPCTFDDATPTANTDGVGMKFGRKFYDEMPEECRATVRVHEVAHNLLGHAWRAPIGADWELWNKACDHEVNLMIKEFSEVVMAKKLADPFPFPPPADSFLANPAFKGMAAEKIYQILSANPPGGGGGNNKPGQGQGQGNQSGKPGGQPGPHSMPSFGQFSKPAGSPAQQKQTQNNWQNTLIQSAMMAKGRGELPGSVARLVDELINPTVPWYELLRAFLRELVRDDYNWMKPNLPLEESGFILPDLDSEGVGGVVFATDTSGSIDHELLRQFQSEKQQCLDELRPTKLTDIYCDSRVTKVADYRPGERIAKDAPGGGGTSFKPVFERAANLPELPKCLVYLTDLDGDFPPVEPPYPVIWIAYNTSKKAPFGETVYASITQNL